MDWIMSPQNTYVEVLTLNNSEFEDKFFKKRELGQNEVIRAGPNPI